MLRSRSQESETLERSESEIWEVGVGKVGVGVGYFYLRFRNPGHSSGRQNGFISRMLFFELCKIMVNKVTFVGFRGSIIPIASSWIHP